MQDNGNWSPLSPTFPVRPSWRVAHQVGEPAQMVLAIGWTWLWILVTACRPWPGEGGVILGLFCLHFSCLISGKLLNFFELGISEFHTTCFDYIHPSPSSSPSHLHCPYSILCPVLSSFFNPSRPFVLSKYSCMPGFLLACSQLIKVYTLREISANFYFVKITWILQYFEILKTLRGKESIINFGIINDIISGKGE